MTEIRDALGQRHSAHEPAMRIVSLVPSETASVADIAGIDRLVGRTDFCVEPEGAVESVPSVGGTKGFDVEAVRDLGPDLVLANKEENSRPLVSALIDAGLTVHVSFPCTVAESNQYLVHLCALLGVDPEADPVRLCVEAAARADLDSQTDGLPVFVPIWKDPWMTFDGRAYASDVLRACGARNVFDDRARRYPLAADLGHRDAWSAERVADRDTRYPRIQLEEVVTRGARVVLLPDEPYAFSSDDFEDFGRLPVQSPLAVECVDGKDLFWYGTRVGGALDRLRVLVTRLAEALG